MIAISPIVAVLIAFAVYVYFSRWRAQSLRDKPFTASWLGFFKAGLPVYPLLSQEEQARLRQLINKGGAVYPKLASVLVYPAGFRVDREQHQADGNVASDERALLGESWSNGKVILSWDDVERGIGDFSDGHNVVLHEFAHQLDSESGTANGTPPLRRNSYK